MGPGKIMARLVYFEAKQANEMAIRRPSFPILNQAEVTLDINLERMYAFLRSPDNHAFKENWLEHVAFFEKNRVMLEVPSIAFLHENERFYSGFFLLSATFYALIPVFMKNL